MQLLSIEYLSLAAEVTVVLLLLAFAWPQKTVEPVEEVSAGKTMSWEPAKFYFLRFCVFRGLYLNRFWASKGNTSSASDPGNPYALPNIEDDEDKPSVPAPWKDRLTQLLNRQGFDTVLKEWMAIDSQHRGDSCLSMVTVNTYADLVPAHGAMVTEQAIQRIASQLVLSLSAKAIIAKYLPDRFLVLHFASQLADCHVDYESVQQSISEPGFFKVAGEPLSLPCSMSIVALGDEGAPNTKIDELDEGVIEAHQSGRNILSRVDDGWTESPPASATVDRTSKPAESDFRPEIDSTQREKTIDTTASPVSTTEQAPLQTSAKANDVRLENDVQPEASNDISAVANPDDIAALLEQINSNKASKSSETQKQPDQNSTAALPANDSTPVNVASATNATDESEVATADDISALFASMKPKAPTAPVAVEATVAPTAPPAVASTTDKVPDAIDVTEAATADDIAALFATIKPNASKVTAPSANVAAPAAEQVTEPNTLATETASAPNSPTSLPTGEELSEVATADDIASLFATVKSGLKPTSSVATETALPLPTGEQLAEAASADDIAMLFQSVKPNAAQSPSTMAQASKPLPAVATTPATQPAAADQAEMDLSSNASADDIAALFASMKK